MNLKAERIEQMIQIINRNLLLALSGQSNNMTNLEFKKLQRVEASVFGHDKFAFEMVHFVKSSKDIQFEGSAAQAWEKSFLKGLETLLVECAVVKDDIERDCFVSRVYSWFSGKLVERRTLPKAMSHSRLEHLKDSVRNYGGSHTLKGLENYENANDADRLAMSKRHQNPDEIMEAIDRKHHHVDKESSVLSAPNYSTLSPRSATAPAYVRHAFPDILPPKTDYASFLPKIPGAEENYGMIYNKPETETEKQMHELWMARRRQEAFEWKTQQHLTMVLDRLELQRSRMESDTLRKQESQLHLKEHRERDRNSPVRPLSADAARGRSYSPPSKRPLSGKRRALLAARAAQSRSMRSGASERDDSSESPSPARPVYEDMEPVPPTTPKAATGDIKVIVTETTGAEQEATIVRPGRSIVVRPVKREVVPMRFKNSAPEKFISNFEKQQYYMELSDSDDDDKPNHNMPKEKGPNNRGGKKGKESKPQKGPVFFKRDRPVIRERPESARMMRVVAQDDPEFKIHYRYSNFRRMPLTAHQERWIVNRETARVKKAEELAIKLFEAAQSKADKKKKNADGGGKDKDKGKAAANKKKAAEAAAAEAANTKPKYKNAEEFMSIHFPNFDTTEHILDNDQHDANGPMRTMQLIECAQVAEAFANHGLEVKESTLVRALVVPQDRPEAICLENMMEGGDGLMTNPLPMEYWRKAVIKSGKKGKKGRKKKG